MIVFKICLMPFVKYFNSEIFVTPHKHKFTSPTNFLVYFHSAKLKHLGRILFKIKTIELAIKYRFR